ncbi:MAG: hypothetical protein RLZZ50_1059 [Verrucomicrobiota bacterium]
MQIDVAFLAGQSNGDGRAPASGLPEPFRAERNDVLLYSHLHGEAPNADGTLGKLGPLRPGRTQFPAGAFGPEIGIGHTLATELSRHSPERRLAIIKYAKGGSSLYGDWRAAGARGGDDGPHYRIFKKVARDGLDALRTLHPDARIRLRALVWIQGESDTSAGLEIAKSYAENLRVMIEAFRSFAKEPDLPVVVTRLSANQLKLSAPDRPEHAPFWAVRECQDKLPSLLRGVKTVHTDGPEFSFLPDRLHFDAQGQLAIGIAVAEEIVAWDGAKFSIPSPAIGP